MTQDSYIAYAAWYIKMLATFASHLLAQTRLLKGPSSHTTD